jgi:hypothetical protein
VNNLIPFELTTSKETIYGEFFSGKSGYEIRLPSHLNDAFRALIRKELTRWLKSPTKVLAIGDLEAYIFMPNHTFEHLNQEQTFKNMFIERYVLGTPLALKATPLEAAVSAGAVVVSSSLYANVLSTLANTVNISINKYTSNNTLFDDIAPKFITTQLSAGMNHILSKHIESIPESNDSVEGLLSKICDETVVGKSLAHIDALLITRFFTLRPMSVASTTSTENIEYALPPISESETVMRELSSFKGGNEACIGDLYFAAQKNHVRPILFVSALGENKCLILKGDVLKSFYDTGAFMFSRNNVG